MSGHTRHVLGGLAVAAALVTGGQTPVGACSCPQATAACESVWTTDAVFVATVLALGPQVESERMLGTHRITWPERIVTLKVTEAFRGVDVGDLEVRASISECSIVFKEQHTYVVFAQRNLLSGALTVPMCSATKPIESAADHLAYLRGPFREPSELGTVRGVAMHREPSVGPVDEGIDVFVTPFAGAQLRLEGYTQAYTGTSKDDGSYEFRVPAGEYRIFVNVREGVYAWPGSEGHPVTLKDNRGCAVANVLVRPDSRISGRLLDGTGRPVPFMSVELASGSVTSEWLSASTKTLTDDRGYFEFKEQDPGHYAPGLTLRRDPSRDVDFALWISPEGTGRPATTVLRSEGRADLGDVRLPSGVTTLTVSGVVVSADGAPVPGAAVRFVDPGPLFDMIGAPVTTDDSGRFFLSVIAGRSYRLQADWQSPVAAPERRFTSTKSEPFEAVGEIPPFRLVLGEVR